MVQAELRRLLCAEVVGGHGSRKGHHSRRRKRGELKGGEVAVTEPAFVGGSDSSEIQTLEQARPAVASAHRDGELDRWIGRHAHDRREPLVVGRGEALPAAFGRWIDYHTMTCCLQARDGAIDGGRLGRESCRRIDADAVAPRTHRKEPERRAAKKLDSRLAHSFSVTPPVTLVW